MKLKINAFLLKVKSSFFVLFLLSSSISAQDNTFKLKCLDLTVEEILQKWSRISDRTLNYSSDNLPGTKHSFSIEGNYEEISMELYPYLGLQAKELSQATIVRKTEENSKYNPSISFKIVDEDQQALPFAYAKNTSLELLYVASAEGIVTINTIMALSDTLTFNYLGYEESNFTLAHIRSQQGMVQLHPSSESVSEIIVIGSPLSTAVLENIDPSAIPQAGSTDQDVITVVQNLPGITNPSESFQDLIIRGGSPDQVQYQWNGIRVLQSSHFFGKISSINPYMIDKVEISKDGYSASNLGTISGGLHMKSKNRIDSLSSMIHLNALYGNIGLSIPITPTFSAKLAVRQSLPQRLQSPLANSFQDQIFQFGKIPDEDFLINIFDLQELVQTETAIKFGDRQLSLWYQVTPKLSLNADFIHMDNRLTFRTESEVLEFSTKDELFQSNLGYNLAANQYWNSFFATTIEYSQSNYSYEYTEVPQISNSEQIGVEHINDIGISNIKLKNKLRIKWLRASFGYERNELNANVLFANRIEAAESLYSNNAHEHVGFLTLHPELVRNLHMDVGIRYSAYNKSQDNRKLIEPRFHLKYRINPVIQLHGHYGRYHQYLSRRNFFTPFQADNGFWYISDESATDFLDFINIVESQQFGGGLDLSKGAFDISVDIFRKNIYNMWSSSFDLSIDENPFNVGDIDITGAEIMLRFQKTNHKVLSTYEYNYERIKFDNVDKASLNPFSQPHRFNLAYEYSWRFLSSTMQYNYAIGRPFSQASELLIENNSANISFNGLLDNRVPNYHRVDLNLRTRPLGKKVKHSFGFQVNNIFNRRNIIKNQYFINLLSDPLELGLLEKRGIERSFNLFYQIDI